MWLYHNFFQPVMRVAEKTVVSEEGQPTRIRRRYDQARTPFDRLCDMKVLAPDIQAQLTALREQTNPRQLLAQIEAQLDYLFSLPSRTPDHPEVVYDTLSETSDPRPEREAVRNIIIWVHTSSSANAPAIARLCKARMKRGKHRAWLQPNCVFTSPPEYGIIR
jgi:hypothetical protein